MTKIGIIGGADGPTSIFIASRVPLIVYIAIIISIVLIAIGLMLWKKKHI